MNEQERRARDWEFGKLVLMVVLLVVAVFFIGHGADWFFHAIPRTIAAIIGAAIGGFVFGFLAGERRTRRRIEQYWRENLGGDGE